MEKAHRRMYVDWEIKYHVKSYRTSKLSLGEFFRKKNIPNACLSRWISKEASDVKRRKRGPEKHAQYPELESRLRQWVDDERQKGYPVTRNDLQIQALDIAKELALGDFKASRSWIAKFMSRENLSSRAVTHTSRKEEFSEKDIEDQERFFNELVEIVDIQESPPKDILNFDQTNVKYVPSKIRTINETGAKQV
ncbi:jerky protein homolog-like [Paramacrobiotus metropolitanus]|uniref:jerky protein homolog-like n=1 Tax=Paramacrobiotus metropolitanus TaxID=2943436 RepID=UPI0024458750|nr:jerky protein homolog-like [Paramacrobiotus metropolitanus]